MNSSLYIGATGMKSLSEGMNVVANNLSNVSTIGFKQQDIQYVDLIYEAQGAMGNSWGAEEDSYVTLGQMGKGVQVGSVRTIFNQGALEQSNRVTDLALSGDGFFEVVNSDGNTMYTRAGNFSFDNQGFLTLPDGSVLNGYAVDREGGVGGLQPIQIDENETLAAKPTSQISLNFNLGNIEDSSASTTDPYFSMAKSFDANSLPPLSNEQYSYAQPLQIYDAEGNAQQLTLYVDGTQELTSGSVLEFVVSADASITNPQASALLAGTMSFNAAGQMTGITYFSPSGDTTDLNNWTPAPTSENGTALLNYNGQSISLDFGVSGTPSNMPATAAAVGTDSTLLGETNDITRSADATTAYAGSNIMYNNEQDGYGEGYLVDIQINADGEIIGSYSNDQNSVLYEIPVARFINEDGLRREGGNMYSATEDSGVAELGKAGTENFADIQSYYIENSNVDMASEMVDMIVTQRGFQSNSKVVTTADEMLKKAIELKR